MRTSITKAEIVDELEENAMYVMSDDSEDRPRPGDDDETTDPKKNDDESDDDGEVIKPGNF